MLLRALLLVMPLTFGACQRSAGVLASEPLAAPPAQLTNSSFIQWQSPEVAKLFYLRATGKFLGAVKSSRGDVYDLCSSASMLRLIKGRLGDALNSQDSVIESTLAEGEEAHLKYCVQNIPSKLFAETAEAVGFLAKRLAENSLTDKERARVQADYCMAVNLLADMQSAPYAISNEQMTSLQSLLQSEKSAVAHHCPFAFNE